MIRCVLVASIALHAAMIAVLPSAEPFVMRAPETSSLVELGNEPPPPPKEEPPVPVPEPAPITPQITNVHRTPPAAAVATVAGANAGPVSDLVPGVAVDGDGPADFTASVISNAGSGAAPRVVVSAPPSPAVRPAGPVIVPVSSLSRRPGAPGLDAELERNYPVEARRAGISGNAKLRVQILADGRVGKVERISESSEGFGEACARTVRAARWDPPLDKDGRAVATEIVYVCKFEVRS